MCVTPFPLLALRFEVEVSKLLLASTALNHYRSSKDFVVFPSHRAAVFENGKAIRSIEAMNLLRSRKGGFCILARL